MDNLFFLKNKFYKYFEVYDYLFLINNKKNFK